MIVLIPDNSRIVFGYGETSSIPGPATCGKDKPSQVVLYEPNHKLLPKATKSGEVLLNWLKAERANKYTVAFGLSSGNYIYGLPDVGDVTSFLVKYLSPGKTYYFVVRGVNDCMPGPWSKEWSVRVGAKTGTFTATNTNASTIVTPSNIPKLQNVQKPSQDSEKVGQSVKASPSPKAANSSPAVKPVVQPKTQQQGFFQKLWNTFTGFFKKK